MSGLGLSRADLPEAPLVLFDRWLGEAAAQGESEAMTLATLGPEGAPDARMVLLRAVSREPGREGLVFFTNYTSAKALGLAAHPACALLFYWGDLADSTPLGARQVRVRGQAERVRAALSDAYFAQRPRLSQLGAWASPQSSVLADRQALDQALALVSARYDGMAVPRPPHWGGYLVVIQTIEFWQGRLGRLHDRFRYTRSATGWHIDRLAP